MERRSLEHRIGRGPTQPPLTEYVLKKNNPPEACNSRGRLFLRATLPGARREWLADRDGAHLLGRCIIAPLIRTQAVGSTHHGMCQSKEILGIGAVPVIQYAPHSRLYRCPKGLLITDFTLPLFSDSAAPLSQVERARSVPAPRFTAWGREFFHGNPELTSNCALATRNEGSFRLHASTFAERCTPFLDLCQKRGNIPWCWLRGTD